MKSVVVLPMVNVTFFFFFFSCEDLIFRGIISRV
jgi:hypothetical protein